MGGYWKKGLNRGERLLRFPLNELVNDLDVNQEQGNRKKHFKKNSITHLSAGKLISGGAYFWRALI